MRGSLADPNHSILVVVDLQPSFLAPIPGADTILRRARFLLGVANTLGIPILATEQYSSRMGHTDPSIAELIPTPSDKLSFSCCGDANFLQSFQNSGRSQAILLGIETHICVNQTAHHLLHAGHEVILATDAIGCRLQQAHEIGLTRMRDAGAILAHTESIAYEWMGSSSHPKFREVLALVKEAL